MSLLCILLDPVERRSVPVKMYRVYGKEKLPSVDNAERAIRPGEDDPDL